MQAIQLPWGVVSVVYKALLKVTVFSEVSNAFSQEKTSTERESIYFILLHSIINFILNNCRSLIKHHLVSRSKYFLSRIKGHFEEAFGPISKITFLYYWFINPLLEEDGGFAWGGDLPVNIQEELSLIVSTVY